MALQNIQAVIFDMDGVIVDSEPLHERVFHDVMDDLGYGRNHGICFADYVGRSDIELWNDFVARHQPPQPVEELLAIKRQRVIEVMRQTEPIFDGLPELVEKLAARYPLAVALGSEGQVIDAVLELRELRRFFGVVVHAGAVPRGKPAPDIFLHTASLLGMPA